MISVRASPVEAVTRHALARSTRAVDRSLERLATGKRINRASDDPAGSIAVTDFKAHERGLAARIDGLLQEDAYLGAREGAHSVLADLLISLDGLVVTAANRSALSDEERRGLQVEADAILSTIDFLANTAKFKNEQILSGLHANALGQGAATRHLPAGDSESFAYSLADLARGGALNLVTGDTDAAHSAVRAAAATINDTRAAVGARSNAIDAELRQLRSELENTSAARSAIEDTDFAKETAELVRAQVLQQAALFASSLATEQVRTLMTSLLA